MTVATPTNRYLDRPAPSSLADVINTILDKGLVLDVYLRASLLGIELLTVDARVVIASVDSYLRFAEAVNRLDLTETEGELTDIWEGINRTGARIKTRGAIQGAKDKVSDVLFGDEDRGT